MNRTKTLSWIFLVLSILWMSLGGYADITGRDGYTFYLEERTYRVSKQHLWSDGIYLMLASILLRIW